MPRRAPCHACSRPATAPTGSAATRVRPSPPWRAHHPHHDGNPPTRSTSRAAHEAAGGEPGAKRREKKKTKPFGQTTKTDTLTGHLAVRPTGEPPPRPPSPTSAAARTADASPLAIGPPPPASRTSDARAPTQRRAHPPPRRRTPHARRLPRPPASRPLTLDHPLTDSSNAARAQQQPRCARRDNAAAASGGRHGHQTPRHATPRRRQTPPRERQSGLEGERKHTKQGAGEARERPHSILAASARWCATSCLMCGYSVA